MSRVRLSMETACCDDPDEEKGGNIMSAKQNRRLSRREFLRMSALTAAGMALAGCAKPSPTAETVQPTEKPAEPVATSEPEEVAPVAEAPAEEKVTLKFWGWQGFIDIDQQLVDMFTEQNPNIEVQYDNFDWNAFISVLKTSMQAGNVADVVQPFGAWVIPYAKGGTLMQVPEEIMTYGQAEEIYYKTTLDGYVYEGKLYGFPQDINQEYGSALVNQTMFEDAGLAFPPEWGTWDEMLADAKEMTKFSDDGTMTVAGLNFINADNIGFLLLAGILEQGGDYFADDGKHFNFDSPEARNTIQLMVDVAQKHQLVDPVLASTAGMSALEGFWNQKNAISLTGVWVAGWGADYPDVKMASAEHPPLFGTEHVFAADSGWGVFVPKQTQQPNEAWEMAKFLGVSTEASEVWIGGGSIPAMQDMIQMAADQNPHLAAVVSVLPKGRFIGDVTDRDKLFFDIWHPRIMEAMIGTKTVDEVADLIHREANAVVDAAG